MRSGWLLRDGDVVCALEMTDTFAERARGLHGRDGCEGALHLARSANRAHGRHEFELDVAFLSADLVVVQLVRVPPWRVALPRKGTRSVLAGRGRGVGSVGACGWPIG